MFKFIKKLMGRKLRLKTTYNHNAIDRVLKDIFLSLDYHNSIPHYNRYGELIYTTTFDKNGIMIYTNQLGERTYDMPGHDGCHDKDVFIITKNKSRNTN
jgi:hypothetical protein